MTDGRGADPSEVTRLLDALRDGDPPEGVLDRLFVLVYDELRGRARGAMAREHRPDHTLQPTALVHEVYQRLIGSIHRIPITDRLHFLRIASRAMGQVLIDHARRHNADRRGGGEAPVSLIEAEVGESESAYDLVELVEALERFEEHDPRGAEIARHKLFTGASNREVARMMELPPTTVDRDWVYARAWLGRALSGDR